MMKPLNWLRPRQDLWINPKHGWTVEQSVNFPRYWYSYAWRRVTWSEWVAAGYQYMGEMTSQGLGKLRSTRASASARWNPDVNERHDDENLSTASTTGQALPTEDEEVA